MFKILITIFVSISLLQNPSNAFDVKEISDKILSLHTNNQANIDFNKHLTHLLTIDTSYLSYKHDFTFDCQIDHAARHSSSENVTINTLRPCDIKVVGAVGDSLTAGLGAGATNILELLYEYREMSFPIGGGNDIDSTMTMPNILKQFSPNLTGFSLDKTWLYTKKGDKLNRAVSGSQAYELMDQVTSLIGLIKSSKEIDFENDWKLVTLFIGANDLCESCRGDKKDLPENYINYIKECLDLMQNSLPKTFVNLITVLNVTLVKELNHNTFCSELHVSECKCGAFPESNQAESDLLELFHTYTRLTEQLVDSGRYDTTDDFTVVLQPFLSNFTAPKLPNGEIDFTYFAPDCFHFSAKTHANSAVALWNNMLEPVGKKKTILPIENKIICPDTEHPYLFTRKNSKMFYN